MKFLFAAFVGAFGLGARAQIPDVELLKTMTRTEYKKLPFARIGVPPQVPPIQNMNNSLRNFDRTSILNQSFQGARLRAASFASARLGGTRFDGTDLREASFEGALVYGCSFRDALGDGGDFRGARFYGNKAPAWSCAGCDFRGADFNASSLTWADLSRADLRGADLSQADVAGVLWRGAVYDGKTRLPFSDERAAALGLRKDSP